MADDNKEPKGSSKNIFHEPWMNQCYNSLTYPDPACVKVMDKVNRALANRVTKPQGSELKQQALFSLLGPEFTEQHFPYHKYNVKILDPPKIKPKQKEKYVQEMREFLNHSLDQAMKDCGYPEDVSDYKEDDELGHFLQKIRTTFKEGLRKHTAQVLQSEEKEKEDRKKEKKKKNEGNSDSDDSDESDDAANDTKPSDVCSEAMLALIEHDPKKKEKYLKGIRAKHLGLSATLRQYLWLDYLKKKEEGKLKLKPGDEAMIIITQNFNKNLTKEMKAQKISRAIRSNSWKTIDSSVIETYDSTTSMKPLDTDEHMIQTVRTLNILTVYSKSYSVSNIHWLMPIQLVYNQRPEDEDEKHVMKLATHVELAIRHCRPTTQEVFTIADSVVGAVKENDKEYYAHINHCLSNQVSRINVKDFPAEVLMKDQKASAKLYADLQKAGTNQMEPKYQELFTDPTIFVRMWIAQGYSGVVSIAAGLWVWDELFLNNWSRKYLQDVGVAILSLIKPWMMRANMYSGARKVFLDEPAKIYLSDLRKSVIHLQEGGAYSEIPDNKNYLGPKGGPKIQVQEEGQKPREPKIDGDNGKRPARASKKDAEKGHRAPSDSPPKRRPQKNAPRGPGAANVVLPFAADRLFQVDLNLESDSDDDYEEPPPIAEPSPDTESESEPSPEPSPPSSPPPPPPPPEHWAWLPHDKATDASLPPATRVSEPCDFYIDAVRFLPDNISHCKVTGRIINMYMSKDENVPDILAYPQLDSSTRCPTFKYKLCLNRDKGGERLYLNPEMIIILRVYGYENHKKEICVVGSCLVRVFRSELKPPKLCVGGRQIRIRHGLPNPPGGLEDLIHTDMDENLIIPGVTICVRLLPASQEHVPAPAYESCYYRSEESRPTETERRLYKHYIYMDDYNTSVVGDHLRKMQSESKEPQLADGPHQQAVIMKYLEKSLDQKAQQKKTKEHIPNIDYTHFIHYDIKLGFKATVLGAFGLPVYMEGRYCHVYCEVLPGIDTVDLPPTAEGHGGYQRFITTELDFLSSQRSPQWAEVESTLHPHYDESSVLLLQLYGFQASYAPGNGTYPGAVTDSKHEFVTFHYGTPLAWAAVQLFDRGSVISGVHWLPLFKGAPGPKVLDMLHKLKPANKLMLIAQKRELVKFHDGASIEVKLFDSHVERRDLLDGRHEDQIDGTKQIEKYVKSHKTIYAHSIDEFVLENMEESVKRDGPIGERFEKERDFFEREANYVFFKAMNEALKEVGKEPLPNIK